MSRGKFQVHYAEGYQIYENDTLLAASEKTTLRAKERMRRPLPSLKNVMPY